MLLLIIIYTRFHLSICTLNLGETINKDCLKS